jgi:quercetin dioxygenase-like cupin family protein
MMRSKIDCRSTGACPMPLATRSSATPMPRPAASAGQSRGDVTAVGLTRRNFNRASLVSLLTAAATASAGAAAAAQQEPASGSSTRRDVIKQELPGEPRRDLILVEVTYPPGTGSPAHLHAKGVAAFVVSGSIASKVGDGPEQTFHAGEAWWEPPGSIHRVSRNASNAEPATLLAIYVAPKGATAAHLMKPL